MMYHVCLLLTWLKCQKMRQPQYSTGTDLEWTADSFEALIKGISVNNFQSSKNADNFSLFPAFPIVFTGKSKSI